MRLNEVAEANPTDVVSCDVPLFIRLLEFAREDAKDDVVLHDLVERAVSAAASGKTLTMADYEMLVGSPTSQQSLVTTNVSPAGEFEIDLGVQDADI